MRATNVRGASYFLITVLLFCSFGCGPSSSQDDQQPPSSSGPLELTDEMINERINGAFVRDVPEENAAGAPIHWTFIHSEPKEITVVDKKVEGTRATIILDIKTSTSPRSREQRQLAGQIKTEWEIVDAQNISMKYRNIEKPPTGNENANANN